MLSFSFYLQSLFLFLFTTGFITLIFSWSHVLAALLALEFMALSIFASISVLSSLSELSSVMSLYFIALAVCEAALGLSIVVSFVRSKGNEMVQSASAWSW